MKKLILTFLGLIGLSLFANAQQVSLFDSKGEARAYIDYDQDSTIFMWDGTPVAFLEKDGNDICVFGFNGIFLGWYEDGLIYNEKGESVGGKEGSVNLRLQREPRKSSQQRVPRKPRTPRTPTTPRWSRSWSSTSLMEFLYSGKEQF